MTDNEVNFSVLMSIYVKENPLWFEEAIRSILNQTVVPDEIVIVQDGKLTEELDKICDYYVKNYNDIFRVIKLPNNQGLGKALQIGVSECRNEWVARMDTDDISLPNRFELQVNFIKKHSDIDIVGGYIDEFSGEIKNKIGHRLLPLENLELRKFAKFRNPFNHMTVMFRRSAVIAAGNYKPFHLMEDYYLWYRMIINNCKIANIPHYLVHARVDNMVDKRGGWKYFCSEYKLYKEFFNSGYIMCIEYIWVLLVRFICRMSPSFLRKKIYYTAVHKKNSEEYDYV